MPGVGGQSWSLASIRSNDVDLGRASGGGPPGADGNMGDVLSGSERLRGPAGTISLRLGSTESPDVLAGAWALGSAALADWSRAIVAVA